MDFLWYWKERPCYMGMGRGAWVQLRNLPTAVALSTLPWEERRRVLRHCLLVPLLLVNEEKKIIKTMLKVLLRSREGREVNHAAERKYRKIIPCDMVRGRGAADTKQRGTKNPQLKTKLRLRSWGSLHPAQPSLTLV